MSEYERPDRSDREPTVEDVRQLMGASAPHFATHLRNRIETLIRDLPVDHPARRLGEREARGSRSNLRFSDNRPRGRSNPARGGP